MRSRSMHGALFVFDEDVSDPPARLRNRLTQLDISVTEDTQDVSHALVYQVAHDGLPAGQALQFDRKALALKAGCVSLDLFLHGELL
jgi:hypothetical protein